MVEFNGARNHLRQQRLENDVVLPIDERDFGLFQFALRKQLAEMDCDIDSAESTTENENTLLCHTNLGSTESSVIEALLSRSQEEQQIGT
jgi:hypothetical protein